MCLLCLFYLYLMMREFSLSVAQPSQVADTRKEEKTIIEDPTGVGPGGEAPMPKLAKDFPY